MASCLAWWVCQASWPLCVWPGTTGPHHVHAPSRMCGMDDSSSCSRNEHASHVDWAIWLSQTTSPPFYRFALALMDTTTTGPARFLRHPSTHPHSPLAPVHRASPSILCVCAGAGASRCGAAGRVWDRWVRFVRDRGRRCGWETMRLGWWARVFQEKSWGWWRWRWWWQRRRQRWWQW